MDANEIVFDVREVREEPEEPPALATPAVQIRQEIFPLHNQFTPDRFFVPGRGEHQGRLTNRYGHRTLLCSADLLLGLQCALQEEVGEAAGEILYRSGLEWGRRDVQRFAEDFAAEYGHPMDQAPFGVALQSWWWPLRASGWGAWSYDLSHRDEGLLFIDLNESVVARAVGVQGKVTCHFYAGLFAAVFGHVARKELSGIEIQCAARGESCCKFLIGPAGRINAAQFWGREGTGWPRPPALEARP